MSKVHKGVSVIFFRGESMSNVGVRWNAAEREIVRRGIGKSDTGMYACAELDGSTIVDALNICALCVFEQGIIEVSDSVKPTNYDGDCDDCGRMSFKIDEADWEDFE